MGMVGQLDSMKLDFVSHVPYELRTPLTSIKAASSMLLEGGFGHSPIATDAGPPKTTPPHPPPETAPVALVNGNVD